MKDIQLNIAKLEHRDHLLNLINAAYRTSDTHSWTNESTLVSGSRISVEMLTTLIEQSQNLNTKDCLYVATVHDPETKLENILGCIAVTKFENTIEIGTFAVQPNLQNSGIGKQILTVLESLMIRNHPNVNSFRMWVLDLRIELINFYQRRGYVLTGQSESYPIDAGVGKPLKDLNVLEMIKEI